MGHFTRAKNVALVVAINELSFIAGYPRNLINFHLCNFEQRKESKQANHDWILRFAQNDALRGLM